MRLSGILWTIYRKRVRTSEEVLSKYLEERGQIESHPHSVPRSHFEYQTIPRILEQSSRALGARRRVKGGGLEGVA